MLAPGARLGPYEITAPLGAGGMGEVYRARDTRLGREVAVKVLPAALSANAALRARFEQEARTISNLHHPNICTLFDVGREGGTDYLVMELVDGETLAQRLARGALPAAEIFALAAQVAEALDRAHRAGVIHRDLKPGNVMVTKSGAKLMDFGLARPGAGGAVPGSGSLALTQSPTVAAPLTTEGSLVGTFQYMSPEQLQGREADARSDVWAFGCLLYEMATGRPAFSGESAASLIASVLKDDPAPLRPREPASAPAAPPALERLVRACLAKDPDERWQSARDLAHALRWAAEGGGDGAPAVSAAPAAPVPSFRSLSFRRGSILNARFASDGRTVIYDAAWEGGERRIYMTRTESPETSELALPSAGLLDVSRQGDLAISIGRRMQGSSWLGNGLLAVAPMFGGSARELEEDVCEAAWSPDGAEMAIIRRVGLDQVLEYPIGRVLYRSHSWLVGPRMSPDGTQVAFYDFASAKGQALMLAHRDGSVHAIADMRFWHGGHAWRPDGQGLYVMQTRQSEGATLEAMDLDGTRRVLHRFPMPYVNLHDVSASGEILLARANTTFTIGYRHPGRPEQASLGSFDFSLGKALSDDGRTLLFDEQGIALGGALHVYVRGTDGSPPVKLAPGYARDLSPDGRRVLSILEGRVRVLPRGVGVPRDLPLHGVAPMHLVTWHPDGRRVLFSGAEPGRPVRLWLVDADDGAPPRPITPEGVSFITGTLGFPMASDGERFFAITPGNVLQVRRLGSDDVLAEFPLGADEEPIRWRGDGGAIWVWRRGDIPARIDMIDVATGERTFWREVAPADAVGAVCSRGMLLTADGEGVAHSFTHLMSDLFLARGIA